MKTNNNKQVRRGFQVQCIKCGDAGGVTMDADELTKFFCKECDAEFTSDDVKTHMAQWSKLLAWIDTAPEYDG